MIKMSINIYLIKIKKKKFQNIIFFFAVMIIKSFYNYYNK
jgi:hypothetical protein